MVFPDFQQTGSSETLIGWKSEKNTFVPLWDRMEGAWLYTLVKPLLSIFVTKWRERGYGLRSQDNSTVNIPCKAHDTLSLEERGAEVERQLKELGTLRRETRTWLVKKGLHNVLLADPLEAPGVARSAQAARELMRDAVHMRPAGYSDQGAFTAMAAGKEAKR